MGAPFRHLPVGASSRLAGVLALLLAAGTAPGWAAEPPPRHAWGAPGIECTCRANGHSYQLGERVCLKTPAGFRVAECRMSQNVTSWALGQEDCVVSALKPSRSAGSGS